MDDVDWWETHFATWKHMFLPSKKYFEMIKTFKQKIDMYITILYVQKTDIFVVYIERQKNQ